MSSDNNAANNGTSAGKSVKTTRIAGDGVGARMSHWAMRLVSCMALFVTPAGGLSLAQDNYLREPKYTAHLAQEFGWESEVRTPIGTYCDLVTPQFAIEVEWTHKPYQAVGQAASYATLLRKRPAIVFLLRGDTPEQRQAEREQVLERIGRVAEQWRIRLWWWDLTTGQFCTSVTPPTP